MCEKVACGQDDTLCSSLTGTAKRLCEYGEDLEDDEEGKFEWGKTDESAKRALQMICGAGSDTVISFTEVPLVANVGSETSATVAVGGSLFGAVAVVASALVAWRWRKKAAVASKSILEGESTEALEVPPIEQSDSQDMPNISL